MRFDARLSVPLFRAASFAIPLVLGVFYASPEPYWLDSPEFTAAAQTLGIPHPPGHPLYIMLVKPFTLLPLGGVAFRVALASAIAGAGASLLLFQLALMLIRRTAHGLPLWLCALGACAAALIAAVAPGWWLQCVRAEVYALQILLVLGVFYPVVHYCLNAHHSDIRWLYLAAFVFGLGLCNHHYMMMACLPAIIPVLVGAARFFGGYGALRLSLKLGAISIFGLLPYLFLPLRSAARPAISLGSVHSVADFFWVVSAKVYQKSMVRDHAQRLDARSLDALYTMMGELGPILLVAAAAGLYLLFRKRDTRLVALVISTMVSVTVLLRAVMGFDPFNPDYYGYMLPALAGLALGLGVFGTVALNVIRVALKDRVWLTALLGVGLLALPAVRAGQAGSRADLSDFKATRLMLDLSLTHASPGSLVLTSYYKLFFALWSARFIDGSRPDVTVINPQFFGYPGYLEATLVAHPELKGLARSMIVHGQVTEPTIAGLALTKPLRVEPDPWLSDDAVRYLLPDGPVYAASPEPLSTTGAMAAAKSHLNRWRGFYHLLGTRWHEQETLRMLIWCHFQDAIYYARRGARKESIKAIEMARALGSEAPQLTALLEALKGDDRGAVDISPFLPASALSVF